MKMGILPWRWATRQDDGRACPKVCRSTDPCSCRRLLASSVRFGMLSVLASHSMGVCVCVCLCVHVCRSQHRHGIPVHLLPSWLLKLPQTVGKVIPEAGQATSVHNAQSAWSMFSPRGRAPRLATGSRPDGCQD